DQVPRSYELIVGLHESPEQSFGLREQRRRLEPRSTQGMSANCKRTHQRIFQRTSTGWSARRRPQPELSNAQTPVECGGQSGQKENILPAPPPSPGPPSPQSVASKMDLRANRCGGPETPPVARH